MLSIPDHSFGMGDRFAQEGRAQLSAIIRAKQQGLDICPVWNKSHREHTIVGSSPLDLRAEADQAVHACGWDQPYFVDADHINLKNVEHFLPASDFYTIDVADYTGQPADPDASQAFEKSMEPYLGTVKIPGIEESLVLSSAAIQAAANKFLLAILEAGKIYHHIAATKGEDQFVAEVSVDETTTPQTPLELFLILAMIAQQGIKAQTIAPKFTGSFFKGVDYVGDLAAFEKEFDQDLCVIKFAISQFGLPNNLKLSVHSGSDKFSLYPIINRLIKEHSAGLHVKTAGTTWLEEVIGLAEAGGAGLNLAKEIYNTAYPLADDLIAPYAPVVNITPSQLPTPEAVQAWSSEEFVATLRHDQTNQSYAPQFRQFVHVSFKIAAKMGDRFMSALQEHRDAIERNVTHNLLERHIKPIFA